MYPYLQCALAHALLFPSPMTALLLSRIDSANIPGIVLLKSEVHKISVSSHIVVYGSIVKLPERAENLEVERPTRCKIRSALTVSQRRDMRSLWVLETESGSQCGCRKVWGEVGSSRGSLGLYMDETFSEQLLARLVPRILRGQAENNNVKLKRIL